MNTDEKILSMLEENPEKGATLLVERYWSVVRSVCAQKLDRREDIDECVNDVLAEFCMKYREYNEEKGNLKNYLCLIAERRAIDKYRKNCRNEEAERKILENYKIELSEKDNQEELLEKLDEAMEKIEPLDRKILKKHYYEGLGYKEIAKELDMNYEAVKKRGIRGKRKLLYFILLGILVLAITACTAVVMKDQGVLPLWFPFYELIPELEYKKDDKTVQEQKVVLYLETGKEQDLEEEEQVFGGSEVVVESEDVKKYQITNMHGLLWSDEAAYEMIVENQKIQRENMIYELKDVFYQNGKWEIQMIVEYFGPEREKYEEYVQGSMTNKEWFECMQEKNTWLMNEEIYLESSYLLFADGERCYLQCSGAENIDMSNEYKYILSYTAENVLDKEGETEKIFLVLPNGEFFEITMEKVRVEEYEEKVEKTEENNRISLEGGITRLENGRAIVGVCQKNMEEYQVAPMITQDYFGPIGIEQKNPVLIDRDGNEYNRMRVNMQDVNGDRMFEVYFMNVDPGEYTFYIPHLCIQKEMKTEPIEIPLPVGESEDLECDIPVCFSDGTGFRIKNIKRREFIEEIYYEDDGVLTRDEQRYWTYELIYDPLDKVTSENEYIFNVARAAGKTSNGDEVVAGIRQIENEMKYMLKTNSAELSESMEVQFYEPLYLWNQEFSFDIVLKN